AALKANASGIILAHNHPSGNIKPSTADVGQTRKIINGGEVLEIRILDHLIVTPDGYYSFKDEGLICYHGHHRYLCRPQRSDCIARYHRSYHRKGYTRCHR